MYKIIACDLDETLLGKDKKISPEINDLFKKLGILVSNSSLLQGAVLQ